MRNRMVHVGIAGLTVVASAPQAAWAQDTRGRRPDTLQTIGVGARSIGLGGAFVAIADDITASFWNPAGLATLDRTQIAVDFRTLVRTNLFDQTLLGGAVRSDINSTNLQFSYGGIAYPLYRGARLRLPSPGTAGSGGPAAGTAPRLTKQKIPVEIEVPDEADPSKTRRVKGLLEVEVPVQDSPPAANQALERVAPRRYGTVSASRTLGGFEQVVRVEPGNTRRLDLARYWYNSIGYGYRANDKLRLGGAVHYVQLNIAQDIVDLGGVTPPVDLNDNADGVTFGVGALYQPGGQQGPLTVGLHYLHPTRLGDSDAAGDFFGDRISGRTSLGVAYRMNDVWQKGARLLLAAEGRYYFSGLDPTAVEQRRNTADGHFGVEYQFRPQGAAPEAKADGTPGTDTRAYWSVRAGFFTRNSPDKALFFNDRMVTGGFGYRRGPYRFDLGAEKSIRTGDPLLTTSFRLDLK